jgi:hypothetical protein
MVFNLIPLSYTKTKHQIKKIHEKTLSDKKGLFFTHTGLVFQGKIYCIN